MNSQATLFDCDIEVQKNDPGSQTIKIQHLVRGSHCESELFEVFAQGVGCSFDKYGNGVPVVINVDWVGDLTEIDIETTDTCLCSERPQIEVMSGKKSRDIYYLRCSGRDLEEKKYTHSFYKVNRTTQNPCLDVYHLGTQVNEPVTVPLPDPPRDWMNAPSVVNSSYTNSDDFILYLSRYNLVQKK